ncbi:hypothetical protein FRC02_007699 [Tulasnella sp. 418]|nr:hypothetical protein FRC02_007699 [Tulasnella sp. 418]
MDKGYVTVEGIMTSGNLSGRMYYELSIKLYICGPSEPAARKKLEPLLIWATPGQRGFHSGTNENNTGIQGTSLSPKKGQTKGSAASQSNQVQQSAEWKKRLEAVAKARELADMMQGLSKVDDAGRRATMLDALCGGDILNLPVHPDPPSKSKGNLKSDLLKHQSQALKWCIEREYPVLPKKETDPELQFWKFARQGNKTFYYNVVTKTPQVEPPALGRGGFMADSMGLGKTLTMLSLILATIDDIPANRSNATLIMVPLSVLSNWTSQMEEHVVPGKLKYCVYHGEAGKKFTAEELKKYDIVLSTLQMVAQEYSAGSQGAPAKKKAKKGGGLMDVPWKRIILDEGHNVRNIKTKMSQAVCALDAERRWIVSGTPIINSPNDLGSLLKFLRICTPLDQPEYFNRLLSRPLARGDPEAVELLKSLMGSACLRRTKEMQDRDGKPLVPLPPVDVTIVRVTLSEKEKELYDTVFAETQKRFAEFVRTNSVRGGAPVQAPMAVNVLSMLTRLRQLALHPSLVPDNYIEELKSAANNNGAPGAINISPEERAMVQQRLYKAIQDSEECPVCFDTLTNPRILPCQHYFCYDCIVEVINRQHLCPMDRRAITMNDLLEAAAPPEDDNEDESDTDDTAEIEKEKPTSSKIQHLISLLKLIPSNEKSLVFSQFTGYLDLIAEQLDIAGISYVRFDGSMSAKKRAEVLVQFSQPLTDNDVETDEEEEVVTRSKKGKGKATAPTKRKSTRNPPVMLISLKAGALGLNLTVASRVFLMDPWWQSAIELQAIDRVNRIGQTKNVYVYQMVAEDTVEARVLAIQDKKKSLIEQAFSGTQRRETAQQKKEAKLQELVALFGSDT